MKLVVLWGLTSQRPSALLAVTLLHESPETWQSAGASIQGCAESQRVQFDRRRFGEAGIACDMVVSGGYQLQRSLLGALGGTVCWLSQTVYGI